MINQEEPTEEGSEQLISPEKPLSDVVSKKLQATVNDETEPVLTLYSCCRWLIGHEGKICSVGGLAARNPAAAYI